MQKIIPNLWFKGNTQEAVDFYLSVFPVSKIITTHYYPKEGLADFQKAFAGKILTIEFEVWGQRFVGINAGPEFTPNPSCSFMVNFDPSRDKDAENHIEEMWNKLMDGGKVLMPFQAYDFSKKYGWIEDKYGFSWQLILTDPHGDPRPNIIPALLFVTENCTQAENAVSYYLSVFKDSKKGIVARYPSGMGGNKEGSIMFSDFVLQNSWFVAMDASNKDHKFKFNEAVSFAIPCKDQKEIDYYWDMLTKNGGQESVCGWLKDKYGLSWQVYPEGIDEWVKDPKAFAKMMTMKKIIIADFE